jgi:formiminotetrahydrofolate cyclodeaminase
MKNDIYEDVRMLAVKLENTGNENVIRDLIDSIDFSSTSIEALLKIRFYLDKLNTMTLDKNIIVEIDSIKAAVERLLS